MSSDEHSASTTIVNVLSNFSNSRVPESYEVDAGTTAGDLVLEVLTRHNMLSKDPHLLYVTLDTLGGSRGLAESVELGDDARLLQRLQLTQRSRKRQSAGLSHVFVMHMRSGGLLKIHDSCIMPGSFYNSLYVSMETTTAQVIALLLASYGSRESATNFRLVAKDTRGREVRRLGVGEFPLAVQQQSRRELGIHLKRAAAAADQTSSPTFHGVAEAPSESVATPRKSPEPLSRGETLARLQASFRDLQRLREQNPNLYDKLLVAGSQEEQAAPHGVGHNGRAKQQVAAASSGFHSARGVDGDPGQFRHSARASAGHRWRQRHAETAADAVADAEAEVAAFRSRHLGGNMSSRGLEPPLVPEQQQQPQQRFQQQQQQQSKRQLPQLPSDSDVRARRLKLEMEAQRQLANTSTATTTATTKRDFQCQAFEEAGLLGRHRAAQHQPSLREILAACEARGCQLARANRGRPWGVRWREVQFGCDANGNQQQAASDSLAAGRKPAIGRRPGAFQRNERLLRYMRTLVAVESVDEAGAAAAGDLQAGDLIVEVNGCLTTGMSPDQIGSLMESQLTLDLLVARQPRASSTPLSNGELSETESGLSDSGVGDADDLRQRLRQLQLRYNDMASQSRSSDQLIERLRSQLTKTARVCLLQHTDARPKSHTESERSFQVIDASRDSPVASAV